MKRSMKAVEEAILGALLLQPDCWGEVESLRGDEFQGARTAALWGELVKIRQAGKGLDLLSVLSHLEGSEFFGSSSEQVWISSLPEKVVSLESVPGLVETLREEGGRLRLAKMAREVLEGVSSGADIHTLIASVESTSTDVSNSVAREDWHGVGDLATEAWVEYQNRHARRQQGILSGVSTGYPSIDQVCGRLVPQSLVIVAGRPAMGKTALLMNLALRMAGEDSSVAVFSLEMPESQVFDRIVSELAEIPHERIRTGEIREHEWGPIGDIAEHLRHGWLPIWIDDQGGQTVEQIRSKARRLKERLKQQGKPPLRVVAVDYLQLVSGSAHMKKASREEQVAHISRNLKNMAKELDVIVIAAAQLNRGVESRKVKLPAMSDLRESGSIEQDADVVMFPHRPGYYDDQADPEEAQILIAKNRHGGMGSAKLRWESQFVRFV